MQTYTQDSQEEDNLFAMKRMCHYIQQKMPDPTPTYTVRTVGHITYLCMFLHHCALALGYNPLSDSTRLYILCLTALGCTSFV